jgi:hypothetical protein
MLEKHNSLYLISTVSFFFIVITTTWLYWQGHNGGFIFDDNSNLQPLTNISDENTTGSYFPFVLNGETSTLGRPLALLTFAFQADSWPSNPWDFKYVNVMIHLLNGCLIFWFILLLARLMEWNEKRSVWLALLTASLWLLHPLHVSTVLYTIQRMTQLSALFTLIGLLLYLYGRQHFLRNNVKSGYFLSTLGVVMGGILATLSKENGVLLVLYLIVLETTVFRTLPPPRYWKLWRSIFLHFPIIILALYFLTHSDGILQAYQIRDFTLGERLLTQTRVLSDYLLKILLLHPTGFGLFQDDFVISHSLLTPPSTLIAIIFIVSLIIAAIVVRHRFPIFAGGILWFFAGHVLESSFIGLIIYFEHRNYLPMLGIIFLISYGVIKLFDYVVTPHLRNLMFSLIIFWFSFFPIMTWSQTDLWGKPVQQTLFWAEQHPHSIAAQAEAFLLAMEFNNVAEAEKYLQRMRQNFPEQTAVYLYWLKLVCSAKQVEMPEISKLLQRLQTSKYDHASLEILSQLAAQQARNQCSVLNAKMVDDLFTTLINNANNSTFQAYFYARYAKFKALEKRYDLAVVNAKKALALKDSLNLRFLTIEWLLRDYQFDEAERAVKQIRAEISPWKVHLYERDIKLYEAKIPALRELQEMGLELQE